MNLTVHKCMTDYSPHKKRRCLGFTLIELMITVSLLSIILMASAPSFQHTVAKSQLSTKANDFITSLNFVRSEAIRLGRSVTLCRSSNGSTCSLSGQWEEGWIAFVDLNKSGTVNSGESLIRAWDALPNGYTLRASSPISHFLRYNAFGGLASASGTFALCYQTKLSGAKAINITAMRPRMGGDLNGDSIPEKESAFNSNNITNCTSP